MRLIADRLVKVFPGVRALDQATLRLEPSSVHALLGENGAGKSTMIKILTGVYQPTSGALAIAGPEGQLIRRTFANPLEAQRAGIGVVHQERNLIPDFSVAENIVLNTPDARRALVDRRAQRRAAAVALERLGVEIDLNRPVRELSVAQMQLVEIARALATDSQILLLDEPTASLTGQDADHLYSVVGRLRDAGRCVVLVSHKLEEVFAVADTVTVLRDGHSVVEAAPLTSLSRAQIIDLMVGRAFAESPLEPRRPTSTRLPALELDRVGTDIGHRHVSLSADYGEIVGLYGLVGAGRSELFRAVLEGGTVTGEVRVEGAPVRIESLEDALHRLRIGYVTENRAEEGVFLDQPASRNVSVTVWKTLAWHGLVRARGEDNLLQHYRKQLDIRLNGPRQAAGQLSGGNQQKLSLAKWLAADCKTLIIDEPTVGIDVRTKAAFHQLIAQLAESGRAIVLITSDLREMIALADRIYVMEDRTIVGEVENDRDYATVSKIVMRLVHAEAIA